MADDGTRSQVSLLYMRYGELRQRCKVDNMFSVVICFVHYVFLFVLRRYDFLSLANLDAIGFHHPVFGLGHCGLVVLM